jgi:hypothetical protein
MGERGEIYCARSLRLHFLHLLSRVSVLALRAPARLKGPPGAELRTQAQVDAIRTAAPSHSNSICSYSGLNDLIAGQGPTDFHVQSPGQDVRNGGDPGLPGHGTCAGGSNPENPPSH